jgi:hypothetical protein
VSGAEQVMAPLPAPLPLELLVPLELVPLLDEPPA